MASSANRVAQNTLILYGRMAITVFISLYTTRLVLQTLGVGDFGLFSLVGGMVSMFGFLHNTMTTATQRFMSYAQGEGNMLKQHKIFNASIVLHLITGVLVVCLLEFVGYFFFSAGFLKVEFSRLFAAKWVYQVAVISALFSVVSVPYDAVMNAHENMMFNAILSIIESVFKLGIALLIEYVFADKLIVYGSSMVALSVLLLIVRIVYCRKKYDECEIDLNKYCEKSIFNEMLRFAGWSSLSATSSMLSVYGQSVILNMFFGTIVNAAQAIANQVSGQLSVFGSTLITALNPVIVKSEGSGNRSYMLKATMTGTKVSFFFTDVSLCTDVYRSSFCIESLVKESS
jgi:O-antigen/teichoic acid export membrane protein